MKKEWTVSKALNEVGGMVKGKVVVVATHTGLTQCGAIDYLRLHARYTIIYK